MPNTTSTPLPDRKEILKQILHDWWYAQGGETKYGTLKNFSEEIEMPNETFSGIWRGRGFPSKANLQRLASKIPLAETAKKLGFPTFGPEISPENGTSTEETGGSITNVNPAGATSGAETSPDPDAPLSSAPPVAKKATPSKHIRWTEEEGTAFALALRHWWEAEGVYEFGTRNLMSQVLSHAFPDRSPSSVTWLRWFNRRNVPMVERQLEFANDVVRGFDRWGFDVRERKAIALPVDREPLGRTLTLNSPISALLKHDSPSVERQMEAVEKIRIYQRQRQGGAPVQSPPLPQSAAPIGVVEFHRTQPRLAQVQAEERRQEPLASATEINKNFESLRADFTAMRSGFRAVHEELRTAVYTGALELGKRKDGLRFIVTAENFKPISVPPTTEEVHDTERLIEELLRRFEVFAANPDHRIRVATQRRLQARSKLLLVGVTRFLSQWSDQLNEMLDMYRDTLHSLENKG